MPAYRKHIPSGIWVLGFVSMLMDISSELIHSLLPVFLVSVLGASAFTVGLIEGVAESAAMIVKVFSGTLSDYLGKRKALAVIGYSLGALSKPLFAIASTSGMVFIARFADRIGKGIRGAPRDALVADLAPVEIRGAAYGLRQSLDTALVQRFSRSVLVRVTPGRVGCRLADRRGARARAASAREADEPCSLAGT
jgi:MFS family permease